MHQADLLIYEIFAISLIKLNLSRYNITVAKTLGLSIKKAEQAEVNHKVFSQSQKGKMTTAGYRTVVIYRKTFRTWLSKFFS